MGSKGIVASSAALGVLLQQGIGDTIRVSLTPEPGGDRTLEVKVAQEILQTHGLPHLRAAGRGLPRLRAHDLDRVPGARPRHPDVHPRGDAGMEARYPGVETLNVAVMGCIVNGPGESKQADIGISLPGTGETPAAPVFVDGQERDPARPDHRRGIQAARRGLRRETLRRPRHSGRIGRFNSTTMPMVTGARTRGTRRHVCV